MRTGLEKMSKRQKKTVHFAGFLVVNITLIFHFISFIVVILKLLAGRLRAKTFELQSIVSYAKV